MTRRRSSATCCAIPRPVSRSELFPAQQQFFDHCWQLRDDGRLRYPEQAIGWIKKTGKTGTSALHGLTTICAFGGRPAEGYCISNDLEQASARVFTAIKQIIEASPLLKREAVIQQSRILFPQTGSFIQPISGDHASAAGGHPTWVSADEVAGFTSEKLYRLFAEMIPVSTVPISVRLTTSTAGYAGEGSLFAAVGLTPGDRTRTARRRRHVVCLGDNAAIAVAKNQRLERSLARRAAQPDPSVTIRTAI